MSASLFDRAKEIIPGGVNSPVRFYEPYPFFASYGRGSKIITQEHDTLIDYCLGYGAVILGHAYFDIISAVKTQLDKGNIFCVPTENEVKLAELIIEMIPNMEMVRLMNTGSESTMHSIRLARAFTKKKKVVKFDGCYHGAYDYVLVSPGSSASTASFDGNLEESMRQTLLLPYNDISALENLVKLNNDIACVIIEPVLANMGLIIPEEDYLSKLRRICEREDIVLIFDEVVTGFRLSPGGASEYFGVVPDIMTLAKSIGNGFPLSALVGKKKIMELLSPKGTVFQGSTYAGNPISVSAGIATLEKLKDVKNDLYPKLSRFSDRLANGIRDHLKDLKFEASINNISSMFQLFFTDEQIKNASNIRKSNYLLYKKLFYELLKSGIFIPPSQFETCFISYSHDDEDIDKTVESFAKALKKVKEIE
ncbi:MAG: glutamate-1-semialdehyde 2,1-aminomutase [Nitrososphaeraceae archaeon]|nr:glutamate-1-semialdehyde 2,1-aminomutase [Nitrososphaeraceae archaeon]MDW0153359.1 glutamate-1-semialdehyde 2,1-aminomutase [Nitrososphaeraceae archaeon]